MRLSRSRLLLDVSSVYHCQPTVSWWPESGQVIVVVTHTTPRPVDHTNALEWRATAAAVVPNSPTRRPKDAAESRRVGTRSDRRAPGRRPSLRPTAAATRLQRPRPWPGQWTRLAPEPGHRAPPSCEFAGTASVHVDLPLGTPHSRADRGSRPFVGSRLVSADWHAGLTPDRGTERPRALVGPCTRQRRPMSAKIRRRSPAVCGLTHATADHPRPARDSRRDVHM